MYVELEIMPEVQVMLGVRLEGRWRGRHFMEGFLFLFLFSAHMTTASAILSEVRQNSSLHLVNRNMRWRGGTQFHEIQQQDNQEDVSTWEHTHTMSLRPGPEPYSHSENNDFPL